MQYPTTHPDDTVPQGNTFWLAGGLLIAALLAAMAMVCSHQVRRAEVRAATFQVQQTAMSDCLQYIPSATIGSCTRADREPPPNNLTVAGGATTARAAVSPVSYAYR
jgi:hypothetical protein